MEKLGLSHASAWIGDTPEVINRRYVKPTTEALLEAAGLLHQLRSEPQQDGNGPRFAASAIREDDWLSVSEADGRNRLDKRRLRARQRSERR